MTGGTKVLLALLAVAAIAVASCFTYPADGHAARTVPAQVAAQKQAGPASAQSAATDESAATVGKGAMAEMALGSQDAPVTLVAYESLTCPHCARFHAKVFDALKKKYIDTGKVRFVLRDYPLDGLALRAAMLARCTGDAQRYFGMVEVLFRSQDDWARASDPVAKLEKIGRMAGISPQEFDACMKNKELLDFIVRRKIEATKKYGVDSTPSFVIDGKKVLTGEHPLEAFEKVIDPKLD